MSNAGFIISAFPLDEMADGSHSRGAYLHVMAWSYGAQLCLAVSADIDLLVEEPSVFIVAI